jgi:hypothetical protein
MYSTVGSRRASAPGDADPISVHGGGGGERAVVDPAAPAVNARGDMLVGDGGLKDALLMDATANFATTNGGDEVIGRPALAPSFAD